MSIGAAVVFLRTLAFLSPIEAIRGVLLGQVRVDCRHRCLQSAQTLDMTLSLQIREEEVDHPFELLVGVLLLLRGYLVLI